MNEPLTTVRFSGLYGLWYPHGTSDVTFVRLFDNQGRATKLTVLAIRKVNPAAQPVQTEDLGRAHSTAALASRAVAASPSPRPTSWPSPPPTCPTS